MNKPNTNLTPDWLKSLQQKSWEPEILLSGIVLYGMFQLPTALDQFLFFFSSNIFSYVNAMDILVVLFEMGVYWMIMGLILHLICRGLWIGVVGLSYTFPKGIDTSKVNFQPRYLNKLKAIPPLEKIILKLEHICSTIYSISFLLFMSLVGAYIFLLVLFLIPVVVLLLTVDSLRSDLGFQDAATVYLYGIMVVGSIGLLDFLTLGYFRRFRIYAKFYWPFYQIFSYLTLARYYRPTYYAIVTNLNRWGVFLLFFIFSVVSLFGMTSLQVSSPGQYLSRIDIWSDERGDEAYEGYYQDRSPRFASIRAQIPSDIIRDDVLRVFLPAHIFYQDSLKKFMNYDSISSITDESFDEGQYMLGQISRFYDLTIADSTFQSKMYFLNNSATGQRGYLTYLNIGYLQEGIYELVVTGPPTMYEDPFAIVPFYREKN